MQTISHLVFVEAESTCDIKAGTFRYLDAHGEACNADFYVRTCQEFDEGRRGDDYNRQYCEMYMQLMQGGCTRILYQEDTKSFILG